MRPWISSLLAITLTGMCADSILAASNLKESLRVLKAIGKEAEGHDVAMAAWKTVAAAPAEDLPTILAAMDEENLLADNWIRAAVEQIADRTRQSKKRLPHVQLETYVGNRQGSSRSRRLAYELLVTVDPTAPDRWIPRFVDDPSLELRRDAVTPLIAAGDEAVKSEKVDAAIAVYRKALQHARDLDQIKTVFGALAKLNVDIDLAAHMGFLTTWHIIGPFDNTNGHGFAREFPPEVSIDLREEYPGKNQVVRWQRFTTDDDFGMVDLNECLDNYKGAAAYALAFFDAVESQSVELRLGCINANKIWMNGKLLAVNEVYHAGSDIDQYVGQGVVQRGRNTILLKICQNEQTDSWAQVWRFQLRVCDERGAAIHPVAAAR